MKNGALEDLITEHFQNNAIKSERSLRNKEIQQDIIDIMDKEGISYYEFTMNSGMIARVNKRDIEKKKLDKKGLAEDLDIATKELTSQKMVEMTEKKELTSEQVKNHIVPEKKVQLKLKQKKPKQKKGDA